MSYVFIHQITNKGIPSRITHETLYHANSKEEVFELINSGKTRFNVFKVGECELSHEQWRNRAREYHEQQQLDKERAEYERLKKKFEK